ncbi:MAG: hypothetical protein GY810_11815 [Aureispira sp.]|nr:hypothetical protein [Aureispira sp.]
MKLLRLSLCISTLLFAFAACNTDGGEKEKDFLIGHWTFTKGKADGAPQVAGDPNSLWNDLSVDFTDKQIEFVVFEQLGFSKTAEYELKESTIQIKNPKLDFKVQELTENKLHFDFSVSLEGQQHHLDMEFEKK